MATKASWAVLYGRSGPVEYCQRMVRNFSTLIILPRLAEPVLPVEDRAGRIADLDDRREQEEDGCEKDEPGSSAQQVEEPLARTSERRAGIDLPKPYADAADG